MFETSMVAILVAALCALIREYGGFDALLAGIHKVFKGKKGGQLGMGLLVGAMDVATANNTVAIIAKDSVDPGYIFCCFPGDYSVWCTDVGGNFSGA